MAGKISNFNCVGQEGRLEKRFYCMFSLVNQLRHKIDTSSRSWKKGCAGAGIENRDAIRICSLFAGKEPFSCLAGPIIIITQFRGKNAMDILYWLFYTYSRKLSLLPGGQPPNVCSSWNKFKNTGLNRWVIFSHEILRVLFTIQNILRIFSGLNWFNKTHIQLKSCKYKLTLQKLRQGGIHNHRTKAFLIIFGNIFTPTYPYWLD